MKSLTQNIGLVIVIITAAVFYLVNLGQLPLEDYDEATYASVLKSSFERGNFLNLQYFGSNWFEKPPLQFWLMAGSVKIFGFDEFGLRLPSVFFGILTAALTYLIVYELTKDRITGTLGGLILIFTPFCIAATRNLRMDAPVTAMILATLYFWILGTKKPRYLLLIGMGIGLGVMLKSIIGLLAVPLILIWALCAKNWSWLKNKNLYAGLALGLAIAAPWHIYESLRFGRAFWNDYLGYHIWQRYGENILASRITVGYYIYALWKIAQPFLPLLVLSAATLPALYKKQNRERTKSTAPYLAASLLSILFIFLLFSFSKTKLITYYTPLYPFAAIAAGLTYTGLKSTIRYAHRYLLTLSVLIIVVWFGIYGISEAFANPKIYVTRAAFDEKAIGLYLATKHSNEEINIFNWNHHNTIRYYSNRLTESLQFNTSRELQPPFWMIMSTEVFHKNEFLKRFPAPYSGEYLTLVHFEKE